MVLAASGRNGLPLIRAWRIRGVPRMKVNDIHEAKMIVLGHIIACRVPTL